MRRLFAREALARPWKLALLLGVLVGALAGAGWAAYATSTSASVGTIKACVKPGTGVLRLNTGSGCLATEQAVEWQSSDSTVRHTSLFALQGQTVTSPLLGDIGELGTISFHGELSGGIPTGSITYKPNDGAVAVFYSPEVTGTPTTTSMNFPNTPDHLTVPWTTTIGGTVWFEMMIESQQPDRANPPLLTTIHGSFVAFEVGYGYYLQVDTSNVAGERNITG